MSLTPDITEDAILTAVRSFLLEIVGSGVEVIQAQGNRVPEPHGADFIIMTPKNRTRLATTVDSWVRTDPAPVIMSRTASTQIDIQLDIHGPNGSDYAQAIATLARDGWACERFTNPNIQPLDATDGHQVPFHNGEGQYENRWVMDLTVQANPTLSTPQDFAATLAATLIPIP